MPMKIVATFDVKHLGQLMAPEQGVQRSCMPVSEQIVMS